MSEREGMLRGFRTPASGENDARADGGRADPVTLDPGDLTTHSVCLGATGSGKTGLCIALLEEALGEAVTGTAGALLGLLGLDVEPLRSPEHVLVSSVARGSCRSF